jgi:hypothetical protein
MEKLWQDSIANAAEFVDDVITKGRPCPVRGLSRGFLAAVARSVR